MRIKMILSYDGSHYAGWQRQENAVGIETIVMQAMERIHHHPVMIYASGRTDAGVHAFGQVKHLHVRILFLQIFHPGLFKTDITYPKISTTLPYPHHLLRGRVVCFRTVSFRHDAYYIELISGYYFCKVS